MPRRIYSQVLFILGYGNLFFMDIGIIVEILDTKL